MLEIYTASYNYACYIYNAAGALELTPLGIHEMVPVIHNRRGFKVTMRADLTHRASILAKARFYFWLNSGDLD